MKAKRAKQYRKLMHQYGLHFGFREPFQVLLDAGIIQDAARFKMKLGAMLENTLHGPIKPMITQCCIRHLYDLTASTPAEQAEKESWIAAAKGAERRRCGHHELEEPLSALACLESVVDPKDSGRNKHRYVVASQDDDVRRKMRGIAGVPLVYINRSVMILEPMAMATNEVRQREEKAKMRSGLKSRAESSGVKRKREENENEVLHTNDAREPAEHEPKKRKVRGPKGANPLSVMKPKKSKEGMKGTSSAKAAEVKLRRPEQDVPRPVEKTWHNGLLKNSIKPIKDDSMGEVKKRKRKRIPKDIDGDDPVGIGGETVVGANE